MLMSSLNEMPSLGHLAISLRGPSKLRAALQGASPPNNIFVLSESPMEKHTDATTEEMLLGW